jgi:hypothetical protein
MPLQIDLEHVTNPENLRRALAKIIAKLNELEQRAGIDRDEFDALAANTDDQVGQVRTRLVKSAVVTNRRIGAVDTRVGAVDTRVGLVDARVGVVDARIDTAVAQASAKLDLRIDSVVKDFKEYRTQALFLANLSYFFALMAKQYRDSYKEISEVVEGKTPREVLLYGTRDVLVTLFMAGLAGVSAGLAQAMVLTVSKPLVDALAAKLQGGDAFHFSSPFGAVMMQGSDNAGTAANAQAAAEDGVKETHKQITDKAAEKVGDGLATRAVGEAFERKIKAIDPYDFFLDAEVKLRKLAAEVHAGVHASLAAAAKAAVGEVTKGGFFEESFKFLDHPITDKKKHWKEIQEDIEVYIRRMIWRMHCRAQWGNSVSRYVIRAHDVWGDDDLKGKELKSRGLKDLVDAKVLDNLKTDAKRWPYEVWARERGAFPPFFEEICAAFKGSEPEHQPGHVFYKHNPWVSLAAVACCQVQRGDVWRGARFHLSPNEMRIDLERNRHEGGKDQPLTDREAGKTWTTYVSDWDLVFGDPANVANLQAVLDLIHTKGGRYVSISEIRVGSPGSWRSIDSDTAKHWVAGGKKGKTTSADVVLKMAAGDWVTVFVQASERGTDVREAKVTVVETDKDGKEKAGAAPIASLSKNFATSASQHMSFPIPKGSYAVKLSSVEGLSLQKGNAMWSHRTVFDESSWRIEAK